MGDSHGNYLECVLAYGGGHVPSGLGQMARFASHSRRKGGHHPSADEICRPPLANQRVGAHVRGASLSLSPKKIMLGLDKSYLTHIHDSMHLRFRIVT
jgi:hypothetical protein